MACHGRLGPTDPAQNQGSRSCAGDRHPCAAAPRRGCWTFLEVVSDPTWACGAFFFLQENSSAPPPRNFEALGNLLCAPEAREKCTTVNFAQGRISHQICGLFPTPNRNFSKGNHCFQALTCPRALSFSRRAARAASALPSAGACAFATAVRHHPGNSPANHTGAARVVARSCAQLRAVACTLRAGLNTTLAAPCMQPQS